MSEHENEHRDEAPSAEHPAPIPGPAPGEEVGPGSAEAQETGETEAAGHPEHFEEPPRPAAPIPTVEQPMPSLAAPPHPGQVEAESARAMLNNLWRHFCEYVRLYPHPVDPGSDPHLAAGFAAAQQQVAHTERVNTTPGGA